MFEDLSLERARSSPGGDAIASGGERGDESDDDPLGSGIVADLLQLHGLELRDTVTDGDCMYDALCQQLQLVEGLELDIQELRGKVSALIKANKRHLKPFLIRKSVKALAREAAHLSSWNGESGDIAAQIVATVLQREIAVIHPQGVHVHRPIHRLKTSSKTTVPASQE